MKYIWEEARGELCQSNVRERRGTPAPVDRRAAASSDNTILTLVHVSVTVQTYIHEKEGVTKKTEKKAHHVLYFQKVGALRISNMII